MTPVPVQLPQKPLPKPGRKARSHHPIHPNPRQRPKAHLQRASPVDPPLKWILPPPALQLPHNLVEPGIVPRNQPDLRQQNQMLMPVQLPDVLVVPRPRRVQIRNQPKVPSPGFLPAPIIPPPPNLVTSLDSPAQQWKPMRPDLLRQLDRFSGKLGPRNPPRRSAWIRQQRLRLMVSARRPHRHHEVRRLLTQPKRDLLTAPQFWRLPLV